MSDDLRELKMRVTRIDSRLIDAEERLRQVELNVHGDTGLGLVSLRLQLEAIKQEIRKIHSSQIEIEKNNERADAARIVAGEATKRLGSLIYVSILVSLVVFAILLTVLLTGAA